MADDVKPRPQGTVEVGEIITVTSAPDAVVLPQFILDRDIFSGGKRPPFQVGNFNPTLFEGDDPATLQLKKVEVFDLNFCGVTFEEEVYLAFEDFGRGPQNGDKRKVRGVCETLAKKLIAAQEEIFVQFAQQRIPFKEPIDANAFKSWCGLRTKNGGWSFRKGPHFGGSAIDLNVTGCPYVATGTSDKSLVGGEQRRDMSQAQKDALKPRFEAALDVYLRAVKFVHGDSADFDLSPKQKGEDPALLYGRFEKVHLSLQQYFEYGFDSRSPKDRAPKTLEKGEVHAPVSVDEFIARVSADFDLDPALPDSFASTHPSFQAGMAGDRTAFLTPMFEQLKADHEALRFVMIHGDMAFVPSTQPGAAKGALDCDLTGMRTRDPCFGFLDIRQEIVVALLNQGLRWGAAMFSDFANGDMMHFDLGQEVNPDLKNDDNPLKLGYRKTLVAPPPKKKRK